MCGPLKKEGAPSLEMNDDCVEALHPNSVGGFTNWESHYRYGDGGDRVNGRGCFARCVEWNGTGIRHSVFETHVSQCHTTQQKQRQRQGQHSIHASMHMHCERSRGQYGTQGQQRGHRPTRNDTTNHTTVLNASWPNAACSHQSEYYCQWPCSMPMPMPMPNTQVSSSPC